MFSVNLLAAFRKILTLDSKAHAAQVWGTIYPCPKRDQKQGFFEQLCHDYFGDKF